MKKPEDILHTIKNSDISRTEADSLWRTIEAKMAAERKKRRFFLPLFSPRYRIASAFLSVLAVFVSMAGVVSASDSAKPGDLLYPVDLAIENIRLRLATDNKSWVRLKIRFAEERLEEVRVIIAEEKQKSRAQNQEENATKNSYATGTASSSEKTLPKKSLPSKAQIALSSATEYLAESKKEIENKGGGISAEKINNAIVRLDGIADKYEKENENERGTMQDARTRIRNMAEEIRKNALERTRAGIEENAEELKNNSVSSQNFIEKSKNETSVKIKNSETAPIDFTEEENNENLREQGRKEIQTSDEDTTKPEEEAEESLTENSATQYEENLNERAEQLRDMRSSFYERLQSFFSRGGGVSPTSSDIELKENIRTRSDDRMRH